MHKINLIIFLFIFLGSSALFAQDKYTLSGIVEEASSNETLIGANIILSDLNTGVSTNEYGFYSITLPAGEYTIHISSIGFQDITQVINLNQNLKMNFRLNETVEELAEVVVTSDIEKIDISNPQMSVNRLTVETIKNIPVVFGEADVVNSILLLPGVTSAGEASTGFNVRGGAVDQNLILLDEAIIFNSSHMFGLFSVFNPDAIKSVKLYKGGIPARYGGRVSSVLDIFQKEGNSKDFKINGGIGTMAGRLLVEGPIVKDRVAFLVGGRVSYGHYLLPLLDNVNSANFYDLNAKVNYKINDKSNIFLSSYFGRDRFSIHESFVNTFGNAVVNFRWNNFISEKVFSNLSLIYSNYHYGLELDLQGFKWTSNISSFNIKYDFKNYVSDRLQVNYGVSNIFYKFNPGIIEPSNPDSDVQEEHLIKKSANEFAFYVDIIHDITKGLSLQYGVRLSHFTRLDQDSLNVYKYDDPLFFDPFLLIYRGAEPIDVELPSGNGFINMFVNLEPRISLAFKFNPNTSIKASYNRMTQNLHLLSNTSSPTPVDVWTPSGPFVKPQILNQYALGFFKNFRNSTYSIETEVFYKDIENRIDYIDGADLIANNAIEQVIINGEARAYGLEILFRKNEGKFTAWAKVA